MRSKTINRQFIELLIIGMTLMLLLCLIIFVEAHDGLVNKKKERDAFGMTQSTLAYYSYLNSLVLGRDKLSINNYLNGLLGQEGLQYIEFVRTYPDVEQIVPGCSLVMPDNTHEASIPSCSVLNDGRIITVQELRSGLRTLGFLIKIKTFEAVPFFERENVPIEMIGAFIFIVFFGSYYGWCLNKHVARPLQRMALRPNDFSLGCGGPYAVRELQLLSESIGHAHRELVDKSRLAAIGRTTAMVAHDIRRPFAQMKSLLEMLPEKYGDPKFINQAVAHVRDSILKTDSILGDILEYSREAKMSADDVVFHKAIVSALGDVFKNAAADDIVVLYALRHTRCLHVDDFKVTRVFANIIENAVDAMKGHGRLWIETADVDGEGGASVSVTIANDGPRITPDDRAHLFEPFYTRDKSGGTGLGLAICQKIVVAHGGSIDVTSGDYRTEFVITLPAGIRGDMIDESTLIRHSREIQDIMPVEPKDRSISEDIRLFLERGKVMGRQPYLMIVDDEPLFRETIRTLINRIPEVRDNLKVVEADSAERALEQFGMHAFDYVISDIDMGRTNMDGYEFARSVLNSYPSSLVMIHSNKRIHERDADLVGRRNFQGFLPKPMDEGELMHFLAGKRFEQKKRLHDVVPLKTHKVVQKQRPDGEKRVLVVNDEDIMRVGLAFSLRKYEGVHVYDAAGISDAMDVIRHQSIDIVLADINLDDDGNGYDLLRKVRESGSSMKFYMMSGMQREDEWPKAQELGADGYIQIPYNDEALRDILT